MKYFAIGYTIIVLVYLAFILYICWMDYKDR